MNWLFLLIIIHIMIVWIRAIRRGLYARSSYYSFDAGITIEWPMTTILIPAWQERQTIDECVNALLELDYPLWEIIIIAGGDDGTYEHVLQSFQEIKLIKVVKQQPSGKNAALNKGFAQARGDVIVLLDADCLVETQWLREIVQPLISGYKASTGNPIPKRLTPISKGECMTRIVSCEINHTAILHGSGGIAFRKELIEGMCGFPEDVLVGVDWDLNARLASKNVPRIFCEKAKLHTERPATIGEYWHNEIRWRRAHLQSLFRLNDYFLGDIYSAVNNLYIYSLAWFMLLFILFTIVALLQGYYLPILLCTLFGLWILGRRASMTGEVAAFKRDWSWFKLCWIPPLLLILTLAAIIPATLTYHKQVKNWQGPRPKSSL